MSTTIRVSDETHQKIKILCEKRGMTIQGFIRLLVDKEINSNG